MMLMIKCRAQFGNKKGPVDRETITRKAGCSISHSLNCLPLRKNNDLHMFLRNNPESIKHLQNLLIISPYNEGRGQFLTNIIALGDHYYAKRTQKYKVNHTLEIFT